MAGVTTAAVALVTSPAYAHDIRVNYANYDANVWPNGLGYARVYSSHTKVNACDVAADNKGVRAWYIDNRNVHRVINDGNGSSDGCGTATVPNGGTATHVRVCVGGEITSTTGCEAWRTT